MVILKIIHTEWTDSIELNIQNNRLKRIFKEDESATYKLENNILYVKWDKWSEEIFINHNINKIENSNLYYLCHEIQFVHDTWEDICYIDYFNKIIYRKSVNLFGNFETNENDEIKINWTNNDILLNENKENNNKIPKIIHFIFGFKEQKEEFELYRYIAIKSAYDVNKPIKIYFYYYYEPYGYWWDKIKDILILEKIELPTEIYGNEIHHYAHRADIIRLQKLIEHGGIYLDMDTICLKSFDDLLDYDFVMGEQTNYDDTNIYGLCNAVMLSKPNSEFALKWLDSYKTFRSKGRDENWDEHSVLKPLELSKIYKNNIKILNSNNFFYPLWYNIQEKLFNENYSKEEYKLFIKDSYCIHLWDTYSHEYLKKLTELDIMNKNTLYNIFSRKFLRNKISIVFLTYNRLEITKRCLNSYLKCLDNTDIEELIIFDNNSDYDTINFLKDFQENHNKIKLILSNENLGVCGGRIYLFKEAIGDIIVSIDSDAYLNNIDFFNRIKDLLYDERYGIVGIAGAYIKSWDFGTQEDIPEDNPYEFEVDHIAGCCQAFRKDLNLFGFKLDPYYDKFWVEDTDLCMQSLELNKVNFRINQQIYIDHHWGGSGKNFKDMFLKNWTYFSNKWKGKVLKNIN
jgi:mannosyltransferase OCH1-like enzyme